MSVRVKVCSSCSTPGNLGPIAAASQIRWLLTVNRGAESRWVGFYKTRVSASLPLVVQLRFEEDWFALVVSWFSYPALQQLWKVRQQQKKILRNSGSDFGKSKYHQNKLCRNISICDWTQFWAILGSKKVFERILSSYWIIWWIFSLFL